MDFLATSILWDRTCQNDTTPLRNGCSERRQAVSGHARYAKAGATKLPRSQRECPRWRTLVLPAARYGAWPVGCTDNVNTRHHPRWGPAAGRTGSQGAARHAVEPNQRHQQGIAKGPFHGVWGRQVAARSDRAAQLLGGHGNYSQPASKQVTENQQQIHGLYPRRRQVPAVNQVTLPTIST